MVCISCNLDMINACTESSGVVVDGDMSVVTGFEYESVFCLGGMFTGREGEIARIGETGLIVIAVCEQTVSAGAGGLWVDFEITYLINRLKLLSFLAGLMLTMIFDSKPAM